MKFAMITTFFGAHSFGGDAAYVDRLSRALLHAGHQVDVIYNEDSFHLLANGHPLRLYDSPDNIRIFPLQSQAKKLAPLWVHQTGQPGLYKAQIQKLFVENQYDVIHFHNISLIGGPGLFSMNTGTKKPIKLMTAHEHWLQCPMSLLWRLKTKVCEQRTCIRCTLHSKRPPQLWRFLNPPERELANLDALICPSLHTRSLYAENHQIPVYRLPYCLPDKWMPQQSNSSQYKNRSRPYFAIASRLVREKGIHTMLHLMKRFPHLDLLIAGTGPMGKELKSIAPRNVHFIGLLSEDELVPFYQHAIAAIMPSLFYETFGYVALEAFAARTPVILRRIGALPELIDVSNAGYIYQTEDELVYAMQQLAVNSQKRREMGENGFQAWRHNWTTEVHRNMYFSILEEIQSNRVNS